MTTHDAGQTRDAPADAPPISYSGDAPTLAMAAVFDAIRATPTLRALANSLQQFGFLMMTDHFVSFSALARLKEAAANCQAAALALIPDDQDAGEAWQCIIALCDFHRAPPDLAAMCTESGAPADWFDDIAMLTNRIDTRDRMLAKQAREEKRQRTAALQAVMDAAAPGQHLH